MNFIQGLLRRMEYGDYEPIMKYGEIYAEKIGKEHFTLSPQLLKGKTDWALRLDLNRRWGNNGSRTLVDLHFKTLDEIRAPIQQLLQDVNAGVNQPNFTHKAGFFEKLVTTVVAGKIIRAYGRIDHHPKNSGQLKLELFLSWDGFQYWLLLCEGEGSVEWSKWPLGVAETLNRLFQQISPTLS